MKKNQNYKAILLSVTIVLHLILPSASLHAQGITDVYLPVVISDDTDLNAETGAELESAFWMYGLDYRYNFSQKMQDSTTTYDFATTLIDTIIADTIIHDTIFQTIMESLSSHAQTDALPLPPIYAQMGELIDSSLSPTNSILESEQTYIVEVDPLQPWPEWLLGNMIVDTIEGQNLYRIRLSGMDSVTRNQLNIPLDSNILKLIEEGTDTLLTLPVVTAERRYFGSGSNDMDALRRYFGSGSSDEWPESDLIVRAEQLPQLEPEWTSWAYTEAQQENLHNVVRGNGAMIAVLDTGVDYRHRVFEEDSNLNLTKAFDFVDIDLDSLDSGNGIDDDANGLFDEGTGHGTHVTDIIRRVAPDAEIVPIRVLNSDGRGQLWSIVAGIYYAVAIGADVINMSFGTDQNNPLLADAILYARERGVILVAAAGNTGESEAQFPARYEQVISVGAIDRNQRVADFSANYQDDVDINAPGVGVFAAYADDQYAFLTGTSMAAPFISSFYALKYELNGSH